MPAMTPELPWAEYDRILDLLRTGSREELEREALTNPGFPHGTDDFLERRWITNAIDCGSLQAIAWMISKGVDLSFRDDEGNTPLLCALERGMPDKYEVLELLLRKGASTELHGINQWTAAHMAASRDDVDALQVLKRYGADLRAVRIDFGPSTPLEDARTLGCWKAVAFLEGEA